MTFNETKPIYLQIADALCDKILSNFYSADERIPSVRELAISIGVNPNTVARSYEFLQNSRYAYRLDMCYCTRYVAIATRIHSISSFEHSEKHIDLRSKISSNRRLHID